jgi:hypothetical protein
MFPNNITYCFLESEIKKTGKRQNILQKIVFKNRFKEIFSLNIASFDKFKQALKYTILFNILKGSKMSKLSHHFISGKRFQKGQIKPNGNPVTGHSLAKFSK